MWFTTHIPSAHTMLFWHPYDVVLTLWTLCGRQNNVVCLLGVIEPDIAKFTSNTDSQLITVYRPIFWVTCVLRKSSTVKLLLIKSVQSKQEAIMDLWPNGSRWRWAKDRKVAYHMHRYNRSCDWYSVAWWNPSRTETSITTSDWFTTLFIRKSILT